MKMSKEFESYLKFSLVNPNDPDDVKVLDFGQVIGLIHKLSTNREEVFEELLILRMGIERMYLSYKEELDSLKIRLKECESKWVDIYSSQDSRNPLFGEKKLTKQIIDAAVEGNPEYVQLLEGLKLAENYKSYAMIARDAVRELFSVAKAIVENPQDVPSLDEDDREELSAIASMM